MKTLRQACAVAVLTLLLSASARWSSELSRRGINTATANRDGSDRQSYYERHSRDCQPNPLRHRQPFM